MKMNTDSFMASNNKTNYTRIKLLTNGFYNMSFSDLLGYK